MVIAQIIIKMQFPGTMFNTVMVVSIFTFPLLLFVVDF